MGLSKRYFESHPRQHDEDRSHMVRKENKQVTFFGLLVISFFWISGGVYGNEEMLQSGPPGLVFLLLLLTPFLYSLPISLVSIELASAMPYEGGTVAWIEEACGHGFGGHNTFLYIFSYCIDTSVAAVLAAEYLHEISGSTSLPRNLLVPLLGTAFIIIVTATKLFGITSFVRFSTLIAVTSILPSLLYVLIGINRVDPDDWKDYKAREEGIDWNLALSWPLWLNSGFFGIGALTAEIVDAHRVILKVVLILIPLLIIINILPLMVSLGISDDLTLYEAGYFEDLGRELSGEWLRWSLTIGSQLCMIGLYNTQTIICERSTASFVLSRLKKKGPERLDTWWRKFLFDEADTGIGRLYIFVVALLCSVFVWVPFEALVEVSALFSCVNLFFFFYAFLYFKWKRPHMLRPFCVPGGVLGGVLLGIPPVALSSANFYFSVTDSTPILGIPFFKVLMLESVVLVGIISHVCYANRHWFRCITQWTANCRDNLDGSHESSYSSCLCLSWCQIHPIDGAPGNSSDSFATESSPLIRATRPAPVIPQSHDIIHLGNSETLQADNNNHENAPPSQQQKDLTESEI